MTRAIETIYEGGVFKPLETINLPEHQHVVITFELPRALDVGAELEAWRQVYAGLSDQDVADVEAIALDRRNFMRQDSER
jgi:predicted DNA-binding antitoxin AbrB/MazE fold protein